MLIVVEGVDGAGKTTLINRLVEEYKQPFWRLQGINPHLPDAPLTRVLDWVSRLSPYVTVVCDRLPIISEPIYGTVLRGENRLAKEYTPGQVISFLHHYVDRVIYCRPRSFDTLLRSSSVNDQLDGVHSNLTRLVEEYDHLMEEIMVNYATDVRTYDFTNPPADVTNFVFGA